MYAVRSVRTLGRGECEIICGRVGGIVYTVRSAASRPSSTAIERRLRCVHASPTTRLFNPGIVCKVLCGWLTVTHDSLCVCAWLKGNSFIKPSASGQYSNPCFLLLARANFNASVDFTISGHFNEATKNHQLRFQLCRLPLVFKRTN